MRTALVCTVTLSLLLITAAAQAATRTVGPGKTYAKPCEAIAAATAGDVIEIDASGNYDGDHCEWSTDNLTLRGVGGRAKIDAGKNPANAASGKGILVTSAASATFENLELAGAVVADDNGAGIRHQGTNLTVRGCYFHDNQNGILGAPKVDGTGVVLIEKSEFANNGAGDGQSHNMYLNHYASFTLQNSFTRAAKVGHLIKSRALENHILYNRIADEDGGTASYEINLPNAGLSFVIGNLIQQSSTSQNGAIIDYASESTGMNADKHLFVVNNTIVNERSGGTFVQNPVMEPAVLMNNIFAGTGTITSQASPILTTNFTKAMGDPMLVNAAAYDYHLLAGSPCINAGTTPGNGAGQPLLPTSEYEHPLSSRPRNSVGQIDIGAYEFGNPGLPPDAGPDGSAPGDDDAGQGGGGGGGAGDASTDGVGADSDTSSNDSGCGCGVYSAHSSFAPLAGLALVTLLAARRRRGRSLR